MKLRALPRKLDRALRYELLDLWHDMYQARLDAPQGRWSGRCDALERRIKALTPYVGPPRWEAVNIELLEEEIYQRFHADMGYKVTPDMAEVARMRAVREAALSGMGMHLAYQERVKHREMRLAAIREHWQQIDAGKAKR
ncbi:hypothetical protein [Streptosporangium sp. NPDC048865]|uniref:hypothetical protein n=1 Tax=Streptosporangium sp. NPDC048865 TaxID=3155766 RepID=UPI0034165973